MCWNVWTVQFLKTNVIGSCRFLVLDQSNIFYNQSLADLCKKFKKKKKNGSNSNDDILKDPI